MNTNLFKPTPQQEQEYLKRKAKAEAIHKAAKEGRLKCLNPFFKEEE